MIQEGIRTTRRRFAALLILLTIVTHLVSVDASALEPESVPGEYMVKLKDPSLLISGDLDGLASKLGAKIKSTIPSLNLVVVLRAKIEDTESAIKALSQSDLVEFAEPNYIYRAEKTANDPMFGNLWGMKNIAQSDSQGSQGVKDVDIDAEGAWEIETGSDKTLVAVIDTGIDYNHSDLKDNVWTNEIEAKGKTGVDDDGNGIIDDIHGANFFVANPTGDPMDDHGHGSHCSGTIGAKGDDGKGIVGVNWNVKIMAVKFLGADGGGTLEGAVKAIDYATKMGAKIMSNSWGGGGFSQALKDVIESAHKAGALFVAAAGNDSANNDSGDHFPANYDVPNVLSVAAINNKGELASFSNYGMKVLLAAPGVNIYSSLPKDKYASWSGTSMATPHVSGVAALLASHEPTLTNLQLKDRLVATVKPLGQIRKKVKSGGMVNAYNALTNTISPPDLNDPANWQMKTISLSSAHPYKPKTSQEFQVSVSGAREIAIYFSKFETEKNYDKVTVFDKSGTKVAELSGDYDDSFSPAVTGDSAKIIFESDDSVEQNGFDISGVSYR
jgi:subtilisin family serine protease